MAIHLVKSGKTYCGIATRELKPSERWVEAKGLETGLCNCEGCANVKKIQDLRSKGLDMRTIRLLQNSKGGQ